LEWLVLLFPAIVYVWFQFPSPEWDTVTKEAKNLIRQMLNPNVDTRIVASEALKSPWICQRSRVASTLNRQDTIAGLKRFNARRKLKVCMYTAVVSSLGFDMHSTSLLLGRTKS